MVRLIPRMLVTFGLVVATFACSDDNGAITSPDPTTVTQVFSGSLNPNGAFTHTFASTRSGPVTATLTSIGSDASAIGLSLGTLNGTACQVVVANDRATVNTVVTGIASSLGSLCVRLYDVGLLTRQTSYEVTVVHP